MRDRILIALDLDETLVYSALSELDRPEDFRFEDHYVYIRPHLSTFIQKCNELFDIAVWSMGGETYVTDILKKIIPPSIELRFAWPKSVFVNGTAQTLDTLRSPKNLHRLIANGFEPSKVLIIDDNPDDSVIEFGNVLQVQPYCGQPDDCELLLLSGYLQRFRSIKDSRDMARQC